MTATYADSIGAAEIPNVTWDDVGGLTELKEEILSSLLTPITSVGLYRSGLHSFIHLFFYLEIYRAEGTAIISLI